MQDARLKDQVYINESPTEQHYNKYEHKSQLLRPATNYKCTHTYMYTKVIHDHLPGTHH